MPLLRAMAPGIIRPAGASGIIVGTTGNLIYNTTDLGTYTFATGPTVNGGGAKLLMIAVWVTAFSQRTADHTNAVASFTLNGVEANSILFEYLHNAASTGNKYVQAVAGIWDSPTSGAVVLDFTGSMSATGCGIYYANLTGLAASPLGVLVRDQVSTVTTLAFQATTTAANSILFSINGTRTGNKWPFTFTDTNFTSLGEMGTGSSNGSWDCGYRNSLPLGTYSCGGVWTTADNERIGGGAFELKVA